MTVGPEFELLLSLSCTLFTMILDEPHVQNIKKRYGAVLFEALLKSLQ